MPNDDASRTECVPNVNVTTTHVNLTDSFVNVTTTFVNVTMPLVNVNAGPGSSATSKDGFELSVFTQGVTGFGQQLGVDAAGGHQNGRHCHRVDRGEIDSHTGLHSQRSCLGHETYWLAKCGTFQAKRVVSIPFGGDVVLDAVDP